MKGFTLLEVLIAFVILALALAALNGPLSTALAGADTATRLSTRVLAAQSLMDSFGRERPLAAGHPSGDLDNGMSWRAEVAPYQGGRAYSVTVTVEDGGRSYTLSGLKRDDRR